MSFTAKDTEYQDSSARYELPRILYDMLEDAFNQDNSNIVAWMPHGRAFKVHNRTDFENKIMPRYFTEKYDSFRYLLEQWGFCRLSRRGSKDRGAYYHRLFVRGRRHLSSNLTKKEAVDAMPDFIPADDEPDLYQLAIEDPIKFDLKPKGSQTSKSDKGKADSKGGSRSGRASLSSSSAKGQRRQSQGNKGQQNGGKSGQPPTPKDVPSNASSKSVGGASSDSRSAGTNTGAAGGAKAGDKSMNGSKTPTAVASASGKKRPLDVKSPPKKMFIKRSRPMMRPMVTTSSNSKMRKSPAGKSTERTSTLSKNIAIDMHTDAMFLTKVGGPEMDKRMLANRQPKRRSTNAKLQKNKRKTAPSKKGKPVGGGGIVLDEKQQRRRALGLSVFVPQPEDLPTISLCRYYVPTIHHEPTQPCPSTYATLPQEIGLTELFES